ncbi:hypothetical protein BH10CYA1_BH10CYA1_53920 [soil metagenome]
MTKTTEQSLKQKRALEIYLKQKVANLRIISRDLREDYDQICAWHHDGGWLELRRTKAEAEKKKLIKRVGKPSELAALALRVAQKGLVASEKELGRATSPAELQACLKMCRDSQEMARSAFVDLGLLRCK